MENKLSCEQYGEAYKTAFRQTVAILLRRGAKGGMEEEIAQDAWVRGWERLSQLRDPRHIGAWVNTIAVNLYRDHSSRSRRITELSSVGTDPKIPPSVNLSVIDLRRVLARECTMRQRVLLESVYLKHRDLEEVAAELCITRDALNHRLCRARQAVRRILNRAT